MISKLPLQRISVYLAAAVLLTVISAASASAQDGFIDPGIDAYVSRVVLEPSGKIIVGGNFNNVAGQTRNKAARLNANGSLDVFGFPNPQIGGTVLGISRQDDGKLIVYGSFSTVQGQARNSLARLLSDGTLDTTFLPNVNATVASAAIQPDGKILIGGYFTSVGGQPRGRVARLNEDGSLDTTFQDANVLGPSSPYVGSLAVQSDGKVLIAGSFTSVAGQARSLIARLSPDGSLDATFNVSVTGGTITQFVFQPDGKLLISGYFSSVNGTPRTCFARLNPDGSLDTTLANVAVSGNITSFGLQADGKIVVGGEFSQIGSVQRNDLARINPNGTVDETFQDPNANFGGNFFSINSIVVQPDGKILIGGDFSTIANQPRRNVVRLLSNGSLDVPPAQIVTVTTAEDVMNTGGCDSDCSLREAVAAANLNGTGGSTQINFDPTVFNTPRTITLTAGELSISDNRRVTINGPGSNLLTISGGDTSRILRVLRDSSLTILGTRMANGNGVGPGFGSGDGGAIYTDFNGIRSELTIKNCVIENNHAGTGGAIRTNGSWKVNIVDSTINSNTATYNPGGGGIYFDNGSLNITNSTISNNSATFQAGGAGGLAVGSSPSTLTITGSLISGNSGISAGGVAAGCPATISGTVIKDNLASSSGGGLSLGGTTTLIDSTISGNSVTNTTQGIGGGIWNNGQLALTNSTVRNNSAYSGGGVMNGGNMTVAGSTVANNHAIQNGGGIYRNLYNNNPGTTNLPMSVTSSLIEGNTAGGVGGGIFARERIDLVNSTVRLNGSTSNGGGVVVNGGVTLNVTSSTISENNSGGVGGGLYNQLGTLIITNATVSGNHANVLGGGIYNTGDTTLSFSTVAFNRAENSGGGISNASGTITAGNTIIARNIAPVLPDVRGSLISSGYDLIGNSGGVTITGTTTGNILDVDPLLTPLADHGGPTFTHALSLGSPAIDKGNAGTAASTDQRGLLRPVDLPSAPNASSGDGSDIGAYEVQGSEVVSYTISGAVTAADGRGITNARVVITGDALPAPVTVITGRHGSFSFNNLPPGHTYVVTVYARRFTFAAPSRTIDLTANVTDANFVASPITGTTDVNVKRDKPSSDLPVPATKPARPQLQRRP
jgi:uncharacterized delta-60 repeat protein/CSLREA domain-containing protein